MGVGSAAAVDSMPTCLHSGRGSNRSWHGCKSLLVTSGAKTVPSPPDTTRQRVAWLLAYPDTYEIGLPNQGLQILYEILNERDDAVAERTYAPWRDLDALLRERDVPLFSVDTHRAAGEFDVLAFNLSAELVYTNVLNMIDLAGIPVRCGRPRPEHPLVIDRRALRVQPRTARRLRRRGRARRRRRGRRRDHRRGPRVEGGRPHRPRAVLRELAKVPGVYVPSMYDVDYDGADLVVDRAPIRRRPGHRRQAHRRRSRRLAVPEAPARAAHRGRPRPAERRGLPRLHPRVPLLPGRA